MATISVQQFAESAETILARVEAGELVVLTRDGKAVAELRPAQGRPAGLPPAPKVPRRPGSAAGQFVVPADFNDPLPEEILRAFEGR